MTFSYADATRMLSEVEVDEKSKLLNEEVIYFGSYADAIKVDNGMNPPAYEEINSETVLLPPSTTLISVYSEPIRIEYEENERIHQAGCGKLLWNYYACCGIYWTLIGCFCCILPFMILLIIFSFYSESLLSESRSLLSADFFNLRGT